jgi:hypothetical protein
VPTIYHRARFEMVGTLRFAHPTIFCERASAIRRATATNQHDGQITSDFQKSCQARKSKIFRLTSRANHRHNSARLTRLRGARERHERAVRCDGRGGRDRRARRKRTVKSCGSGAAVLALSWRECPADDGGKRCPVCSCAVLFAQIARGTAGAASIRSSLRPLFSGGQMKMQSSGDQRREIAKSYSIVITRESG